MIPYYGLPNTSPTLYDSLTGRARLNIDRSCVGPWTSSLQNVMPISFRTSPQSGARSEDFLQPSVICLDRIGGRSSPLELKSL
ncbi:hypothetical protein L6452_02151 [Arctium lappa]|uniref:Uncharacterized protein n=1 Tax=Arctium lappa TaxID=4217 RepID=A0ACB9FIL1_ARCLA|nr:hypothetical protein L6452_02151 [Arctium lappa]